MSNSLRDQLLKAGLADQQSVRQANSQKRKKRKRGETDLEQTAASKAAAQREADRRARERTLNRRRQEAQAQEADEKAARQMVIDCEIAHDGDERFQFTHNGRIRPIRVSAAQRQDLAAGRLAIARTRGRYRLIPGDQAERIRQRAAFLIAWTAQDAEQPASDDSALSDADAKAYADHPIPDDLIW